MHEDIEGFVIGESGGWSQSQSAVLKQEAENVTQHTDADAEEYARSYVE